MRASGPSPRGGARDAGEAAEQGGGDGGGDGSELSALVSIQVTAYRVALLGVGLGWGLAYNLNFLASSGLRLDDGSLQASALLAADASAGVAALLAPAGSALLAGVLLRLFGAAAVGATLAGLPTVAGLAGPASMVLLCAREIFWFGLGYKLDALVTTALFTVVLLLRFSAAQGTALPLEARPEFDPLSAWSALSAGVLAFGKLFSPLAVDVEEEGELWTKRASRPLSGDEDVEPVYVPAGGAGEDLPYVLSFVVAISVAVLYVFYGLPQV